MARFLGVECPNCTKIFAVAEFAGSVSTPVQEVTVLQDAACPHCGTKYPQLTAELVEFEADDAPVSMRITSNDESP